MSTSKHIDLICVVAVLFALLVTVFFMNGEAFGITPITDGDTADGPFTANDLNGDWDRSGATEIVLTGSGGSVKGNGAYIYDGDVHIVYAGRYILSGELTNGSVIIDADGDDKIWLLLDGVSLHCDDSAAIVVKQAKKVFLTLAEGTENVLSSGAEYAEDSLSSGIDGTIYSRDDLTINGSGSLRVTAEYKHGIVCNDDLVIVGAKLDITAPQDGIHAHDSIRLADMDLTVCAGDDGINASNDDETSFIYVESGAITIPTCYEGIEAIDITIAGGVIDIRPTDDGINANGQGRNSVIRITGGDITIINETGRDADGLDSNGSIYISGGNTFISVNGNNASYAIDYGTENGGECLISGGTIIAAGSSTMAEGFDSSSEQCFIMYNTTTASAGTTVSLTNAAGEVLLSETLPCAFSSLVISTPELQMGETCTISIGGTQAEITVDNSSSSNGFGMGGMFGGMFGGGMGGMGRGGRDFGGGMDGGTDLDQGDDPGFGRFRGGMGGSDAPVEDSLPWPSDETPIVPSVTPPLVAMGEQPGLTDGAVPNGSMGIFTAPENGGFPDMNGGQMPDGGMFPGMGGDQMPDGGTFPGMGDGQMPDMPDDAAGVVPALPEAGADPDGGTDETPETPNSGRGFDRTGQADWNGRFMTQTQAQAQTQPPVSEIPLLGASVLALIIGLVIAFKFKR